MVETTVDIPGVVVTRLDLHADDRGFFAELMRASTSPAPFAQSNHSHSSAGVLRGLHYHQRQADLWYVTRGRALCGLVDLRDRRDPPDSVTVELEAERPTTLYIPPGVAHGYLAVTDLDLIYWVTHEYDASDEHGIAWNDPRLGLEWGTTNPTLSDRDRNNPPLDWDEILIT